MPDPITPAAAPMTPAPAAATKPAAAKQTVDAPVAATVKTFTVASGRTVHGDGDPVGPGGSIDLDPAEGRRLQNLGFLLNDNGDVLVDEKAGPAIIQGAEITES